MKRGLNLGTAGERDALRLLDAYDLTSGLFNCILLSPHPETLAEIRRRLAEATGSLLRWTPDETIRRRTEELAANLAPDQRPVIWLEQEETDVEAWRPVAAWLNWNRDVIRKRAPWMWIVAGPDEIMEALEVQGGDWLSFAGAPIRFDATPTPLPTGAMVRWLHLSDVHLRGLYKWHRRNTLRTLVDHLKELRDKDLGPDLVFVTGDVTANGNHLTYQRAEEFFHEIASTLGLDLAEHFFIVPGNHDVDREAIGAAEDLLLERLKDENDLNVIIEDPRTMSLFGRRLENFYAFTERLLGAARGWHQERPWRVDVREVRGVSVAVLQLNSAWACGPGQKPLVGEVQVRDALRQAEGAFLRIALVHHPVADLRDFDRERLETILHGERGVHFLLRGHLHSNRSLIRGTPDGVLVELAAGVLDYDLAHPKRHLLTEVDLAAGRASVHFYSYAAEGMGFWAADTHAYEGARDDGIWRFDLPTHLTADAADIGPQPISEARRATLTARYRTAAAAVHGSVRFVGFADSRPRRNVRVPELFVPLRLGRRGRQPTEDDESVTTAELLKGLLEPPDDGTGARVVVLGDPGSGKTTLCRFATAAVAGAAGLKDLDLRHEPLPLLLPFRDYVRVCREDGDRDLITYLTAEIRNHLQVPVPDDFVEQAVDAGRAVLLLDGLDEVGSQGEREEMRARVEAFQVQHPRVATLVTSRVAGYDEAPLPEEFEHLELRPFDEEDLKLFVHTWYAVQEPDDARVRDQGSRALLAALDAEPHVRALARNPLLATLIALVHRHEAQLPGERAKLYELCVKTMLETWPAARRRPFDSIDAGLQRAYLESLAYRMQKSRPAVSNPKVVIERTALIETLVEIMSERGGQGTTIRSVAEAWVRFLETGTGLLVEQRPGVFGFFHLSLMEYLAARGMERTEVLVEAIVRHHDQPGWREVCLLAVGSHATDQIFLDDLYAALAEREAWSFLLGGLREEAAFRDEQRSAIVCSAARVLQHRPWWYWEGDQKTFGDILRFSIRHGRWARSFGDDKLSTAEGEELRAIVLLIANDDDSLKILRERKDRHQVTVDMLDFWPGRAIGCWAGKLAPVPLASKWAAESDGELLIARSLAVLNSARDAEKFSRGFMLGLARWTAGFISISNPWETTVEVEDRPGGQSIPLDLIVRPEALILRRKPRAAGPITDSPRVDFRRYFRQSLALMFVRDLPRYLTQYFLQYFSISFAHNFARYFRSNLHQDPVQISTNTTSSPVSSRSPTAAELSSDQAAWRGLPTVKDPAEAEKLAKALVARLGGEASIGLMASAKVEEERLAYAYGRVLNAWLVQVWPTAVDDQLPAEPTDDQLALYLALGWTQSTTTWQWPATERWIGLLSGDPPGHWLPRSQWHLCWLLDDPEDEDHRRGLRESLSEGESDADRPGLSSELGSVLLA